MKWRVIPFLVTGILKKRVNPGKLLGLPWKSIHRKTPWALPGLGMPPALPSFLFFWLSVIFSLNSCWEQRIPGGLFPCNAKQEGCAIFPKEVVLSLSKILPLRLCVCSWLEHVLWVPAAIYSWHFAFASAFANKNSGLEECPTLHSSSAALHMLLSLLFALMAFPAEPRASPAKIWSRKCGI